MNQQIAEMVSQYNRLRELLENSSENVKVESLKKMQNIRQSLWDIFSKTPDQSVIMFNSASDLSGAINILFDSGKIFGIGWVRKTTSKSNPSKIAGSVDTLTVKKVKGYVKGTSGGKKAMEDIMAGRVTIWVSNGKLQNEGYGNWRSIYVKDIRSININGVVNVAIQ